MGYTHYFKAADQNDSRISDEAWKAILSDAEKLIAASPCALAHKCDEPDIKPEIGPDRIFFNGVGDDGHETFVLAQKVENFAFCTTAAKPYDIVVTAILAVVHQHASDKINLDSDGDDSDWQPAVDFASKTLARHIQNPPKNEDY